MGAGFLQTVGIASQRGREIDRENGQQRMQDMQEVQQRDLAQMMADYKYAEQQYEQLRQSGYFDRAAGGASAATRPQHFPQPQRPAPAPAPVPGTPQLPNGAQPMPQFGEQNSLDAAAGTSIPGMSTKPWRYADGGVIPELNATPEAMGDQPVPPNGGGGMPVAPPAAPMGGMPPGGALGADPAAPPMDPAAGMPPAAPKFEGIYDDTQANGAMPTIYADHYRGVGIDVDSPDWPQQLQAAMNNYQTASQSPPVEAESETPQAPTGDDPQMYAYRANNMVDRMLGAAGAMGVDPTGMGGMGPQGPANFADGGVVPFPGFANGGSVGGALGAQPVQGPGTGTSDSVPAMIDGQQPAALSAGEMVIPADVVRQVGVRHFQKMIDQYHRRA